MSNQYYSAIRSVVMLAATDERNLLVSKTQGDGIFPLQCGGEKPWGERVYQYNTSTGVAGGQERTSGETHDK